MMFKPHSQWPPVNLKIITGEGGNRGSWQHRVLVKIPGQLEASFLIFPTLGSIKQSNTVNPVRTGGNSEYVLRHITYLAEITYNSYYSEIRLFGRKRLVIYDF